MAYLWATTLKWPKVMKEPWAKYADDTKEKEWLHLLAQMEEDFMEQNLEKCWGSEQEDHVPGRGRWFAQRLAMRCVPWTAITTGSSLVSAVRGDIKDAVQTRSCICSSCTERFPLYVTGHRESKDPQTGECNAWCYVHFYFSKTTLVNWSVATAVVNFSIL